MDSIALERENKLRDALFIKCDTKEHLHRWIKVYLGLDIPDCIICDDELRSPPSTSCPMDFIWEVYEKCRDGTDINFQQVLAYSSRDGGKTLSAAIIEVLALFHLRRDVGHLAALEAQAKIAKKYVEGFLKRPILREFVTAKNKRELEITRYEDLDGEIISPVQYATLKEHEQMNYTPYTNSIKIVICTVEDCNGLHVPLLICVDGDTELDIGKKTSAKDLFELLKENKISNEFDEIVEPKNNISINTFNLETLNCEFKNIKFAKKTFGDVYEVFTTKGSILASLDHKFFVYDKGYVSLKDIKPKDLMKKISGFDSSDAQVISIEFKKEDWLYDFTVEGNHNFIANGFLSHNCDELDLADPSAVEESKMIPVQDKESGGLPLTFYTSTRKYSFGLVQREIDRAQETGLKIRHWNIIDVTKACPPSRHLPEEPKIPIYYSTLDLKALPEADWNLLNDAEKTRYDMKMGYQGCLQNCKIFAQCQGRLVDKQKSNSKLLKNINTVQALFQHVSVEVARAQLLCQKPSSEGLIYPNFSKQIHMLSAGEIANKITGDKWPPNMTKADLIKLFKELGADFYSGLDHGFTHNFAVVTAALVGHVLYVFDVISVANKELQEKIDLCKQKIYHLRPKIYPDNAYPEQNTTFKKSGFKMIGFAKDVMAGIEGLRVRLKPGTGKDPSIYFLKDDDNVLTLCNDILRYHWKIGANGNPTDEPDSKNDDRLDALRYLCQNVTVNKSKIIASIGPDSGPNPLYKTNPNQNWIKDKVRELTSDSDENVQITGKPGGFMFGF